MIEWISVKDSLPETAYLVIVTDGISVALGEFDMDIWIKPKRLKEITHWCELPKPPK